MMSVMSQAVQGGVGHHRVWKQRHPVLRRPVAGDYDRGLEVPLYHDLVEVLSLRGVERREAEVVDDEQIRAEVFFDTPLPGVVRPCREQGAKELYGFGEQNVVAFAASLVAERLGNVGFPRASVTIKEHMLSFFDKDTTGQIPNEAAVDFSVEGELEPFQGLFFLEGGSGQSEGELFGFSSFDLILHEKLHKLQIAHGAGLSLLKAHLEALEQSPQAQDFQLVVQLMGKVHEATSSGEAK